MSGKRRGKGSSREQSPNAEMCAGIQVASAVAGYIVEYEPSNASDLLVSA
ncbi:MAG: hypothetical protein ABR861_11580 [Terriglobales bacterium]